MMNSKTKTKVNEEKIGELVHANFGTNALIDNVSELEGGMMNTVYLIKYKHSIDGVKEMILKLASQSNADILKYESQIMRTEVVFYEHMCQKDLPIPRLIKYDFSHCLINCDYFFITKIEGNIWDELHDKIDCSNVKKLKYELGGYNAIIHSVKGKYFGYIKEEKRYHFDTWAEAFESMVIDLIMDGRKRLFEFPYDDIISAVNNKKKF